MKVTKSILLGVILAASSILHAQTYTVNVGSGFNCGRVSSPLYCYGIPLALNGVPDGTFWLDTYVTGANVGTGFIYWYNVGDLKEATVTGDSPTYGTVESNGRYYSSAVTSLTTTFKGDHSDGTPYTGSMYLTFSYYYSNGGGGRGGAGAGWRFICTGGTVTIN